MLQKDLREDISAVPSSVGTFMKGNIQNLKGDIEMSLSAAREGIGAEITGAVGTIIYKTVENLGPISNTLILAVTGIQTTVMVHGSSIDQILNFALNVQKVVSGIPFPFHY